MKKLSLLVLLTAACTMSSAYAVDKAVSIKVYTTGSPKPLMVQYSEQVSYIDQVGDQSSNPLDLDHDGNLISTSSYHSNEMKSVRAKITWQGKTLCQFNQPFSPLNTRPMQMYQYYFVLSQKDGTPSCKLVKTGSK